MPADVCRGRDLAIISLTMISESPSTSLEEVLAGSGYLAGMVCKEPAAPPYEIHFRAVDQRIIDRDHAAGP